MYSGGFYHYDTLEEYWAYWSRYIYVNRYMDAPTDLYDRLLALVKDKDYFVLTTNVDHCFQKAGFDKSRLFYTQGDYGLFQCSKPCHRGTYDNEETVKKMVVSQGYCIEEGDGTAPEGILLFRDRHPMSLSGGQKQRVAIASAIASKRSILFFDEPTSGLDYRHMKEVAAVLRQLSTEGVTVYVITHDLELLLDCCTDIIHFAQETSLAIRN